MASGPLCRRRKSMPVNMKYNFIDFIDSEYKTVIIGHINSLIAPWWGVKVPRGHITSSKPAGQYLPRAQGKPGPDEPVIGTHTQNEQEHFTFFFSICLHWSQFFCAKTYLQDRSVLLYISCRLPYLSDPVVPPLYQQGKVTHEGWRCPLHSNSPVGTGTGRWVSVSFLPDSKTLEKRIYIEVHNKVFWFVLYTISYGKCMTNT